MRLLGLDLETTGLDTATARPTELGYVLYQFETKTPLAIRSEILYDSSYPALTEDITRLTGITEHMLQEFGAHPAQALQRLTDFCAKHQVEYIVAHNGENFDKPLLMAELARHPVVDSGGLRSLPWIDTRTDIPFESEPESRRLKHLALDCGFINPFEHRAVFDVLTMLRVLSHYDIQKVLEYQKIPFVTCRAMVGYDERDKAKAERYAWEKIGDKTYPKQWVKRIKENLLPLEIEACKKRGFQSVRIE